MIWTESEIIEFFEMLEVFSAWAKSSGVSRAISSEDVLMYVIVDSLGFDIDKCLDAASIIDKDCPGDGHIAMYGCEDHWGMYDICKLHEA